MNRIQIENYRRFVTSAVVERPARQTNRYAFIALLIILLGVVAALLMK